MTEIPWKLVAAGGVILAIIVAAIGLINYGQKLERAKAEVTRLEGEIEKAEKWKAGALAMIQERNENIERWQAAANEFEVAYRAALLRQPPPEVRWRDRVVETVRLGDCNQAALDAWDLLHQEGIAGVPP